MDLKLEEVADLLQVSESTLHRWLEEGMIPAYRWEDEYRFSRSEIEDWLVKQPLHAAFEEPAEGSHRGNLQFSLCRALHRGEVIPVAGGTKEAVIREVMQHMERAYGLDAEVLTELFMDRERVMSTALGHGIAIPHTRDFLLDTHYDVILAAYPKKPIEFDAIDGQPVHLLFFLFACEDRHHLNLLAKLAHLNTEERAREFFRQQPNKLRMLHFIQTWESHLHKPLPV